MDSEEIKDFELLKKEVAQTFRLTFPYCTAPIEEWKGQEITDFQEELLKKVKAQISEKWFYTHIKTGNDKLPRIDMLNMLSEYAGYRNWNEFISKKKEPETIVRTEQAADGRTKRIASKNLWWLFVALGSVSLLIIILNLKNKPLQVFYHGSLSDLTGTAPAHPEKIDVVVYKDNESPLIIHPDSTTHFSIEASGGRVKFIVRSPYYNSDTIVRLLNEHSVEEKIIVRTDDYALMIHYFSTSNLKDWQKRRMQLDDMITEDAKIYQLYEGSGGMELYNKDEFIDRMTMPLKSLRNVEIVESSYVSGRIKILKFRIAETK